MTRVDGRKMVTPLFIVLVAIGGIIEALGWPSAAGLVGAAALLTMLTALGLRSSLRRTTA